MTSDAAFMKYRTDSFRIPLGRSQPWRVGIVRAPRAHTTKETSKETRQPKPIGFATLNQALDRIPNRAVVGDHKEICYQTPPLKMGRRVSGPNSIRGENGYAPKLRVLKVGKGRGGTKCTSRVHQACWARTGWKACRSGSKTCRAVEKPPASNLLHSIIAESPLQINPIGYAIRSSLSLSRDRYADKSIRSPSEEKSERQRCRCTDAAQPTGRPRPNAPWAGPNSSPSVRLAQDLLSIEASEVSQPFGRQSLEIDERLRSNAASRIAGSPCFCATATGRNLLSRLSTGFYWFYPGTTIASLSHGPCSNQVNRILLR